LDEYANDQLKIGRDHAKQNTITAIRSGELLVLIGLGTEPFSGLIPSHGRIRYFAKNPSNRTGFKPVGIGYKNFDLSIEDDIIDTIYY
jgi:hypothetical protein